MKLVDDTLEFLNDYRDTIYYGLAAALFGWGIWSGLPFRNLWTASIAPILIREFCRWMAWLSSGHPEKLVYSTFIGLPCLTLSGINCLYDVPHEIVAHEYLLIAFSSFFGVLNIILAFMEYHTLSLHGSLRFRTTMRLWWLTYWQDLWDWPRKQKPPKQRLKKAKEALKRLMDKIAEASLPEVILSPASNRDAR